MTYAMTLDNSWELMSEDEMYDVNGGITFGSNYIYFTYNDLAATVGAVAMGYGTFYSAASLAALFIANTAWLNGIVGVGTLIWGLLGVSSIIIGGFLLEAARTQKGLEIKVTYSSSWLFGIKLPGLEFTVR